MKNLFIIPTDKPSRLTKNNLGKFIKLNGLQHQEVNENQNIYITNNEKIKDGDWFYSSFQNEERILKYNKFVIPFPKDKKIILTTDQDLDGVQSIDDEFLEWFVKNPSCEEIEVDDWLDNEGCIAWGLSGRYQIIIPKGELINCPKCRTTDFKNCHSVRCPMRKQELNLNCFDCNKSLQDCTCMEDTIDIKQETLEEEPNFYEKLVEYFKNTPREKVLEDWNKTAECDNIGPTVEEFLGNKEETLEEAAIRLYPDNIIKLGNETSYNAALLKRKDFIDGGNWVKKRMYSEEEVKDAFTQGEKNVYLYQNTDDEQLKYEIKSNLTPNEWFEKHKKK